MLIERHERHNARDQKKKRKRKNIKFKEREFKGKNRARQKVKQQIEVCERHRRDKLYAKESVGKYCTLIK